MKKCAERTNSLYQVNQEEIITTDEVEKAEGEAVYFCDECGELLLYEYE